MLQCCFRARRLSPHPNPPDGALRTLHWVRAIFRYKYANDCACLYWLRTFTHYPQLSDESDRSHCVANRPVWVSHRSFWMSGSLSGSKRTRMDCTTPILAKTRCTNNIWFPRIATNILWYWTTCIGGKSGSIWVPIPTAPIRSSSLVPFRNALEINACA